MHTLINFVEKNVTNNKKNSIYLILEFFRFDFSINISNN